MYLRSALDAATLGDAVRREVQSVDPNIPVFGVHTMEAVVADYLAQRRFALELLGGFAGVAVLLASIGIYGVMAYTFSRRTNEIGIRMAMGAQTGRVLRLVVGQGLRLAFAGLALGLLVAFLSMRLLASLLFGVSAHDLITFAGVSLILTFAAVLACYIPARRATKVDPIIALRYE